MPFRAVDDTVDKDYGIVSYSHGSVANAQMEPIYTWIRNWYSAGQCQSTPPPTPNMTNFKLLYNLFATSCDVSHSVGEPVRSLKSIAR